MKDQLALCSAAHIIGLLPLQVGNLLLERIRALQEKHSIIGDVRGQGLMLGVEMVKDRASKEPAAAETGQVCTSVHNNVSQTRMTSVICIISLRAMTRMRHLYLGCTGLPEQSGSHSETIVGWGSALRECLLGLAEGTIW